MSIEEYEKASKKLFDLSDADKDGLIRYNEFRELYMKVNPVSVLLGQTEAHWVKLFNYVDASEDGMISWPEVWKTLRLREKYDTEVWKKEKVISKPE